MSPSVRPSASADADPILDHLRRAAALALWQLEAIAIRPAAPFRLKSGALSPLYVNGRRGVADPAFLALVTAAAHRLLRRMTTAPPDAIAGGETAGIPYAFHLAAQLARPGLYVRKRAKGYGLSVDDGADDAAAAAGRVEGHVEAGQRVLLVEDLITAGGSKAVFLDALEAAGARVDDVLVVIDRQQGGAARLADRGVRLHSVTDLDTLLDVGEVHGHINAAARAVVEAYRAAPDGWQPPSRSD
ncbi:MAG: orotate phosphoribosyltransferase [Acidobacteriota bacterium]